jgi:hypothetical protein
MNSSTLRWLNAIPPILACCLDFIVTVIGQSPDYWTGDLSAANEANPVGAAFMSYHVSGLFVLTALWLALIFGLSYIVPAKFYKFFTLAVVMGHTVGAASWMKGADGPVKALAIVIFNALIYAGVDLYVGKRNAVTASRTTHSKVRDEALRR